MLSTKKSPIKDNNRTDYLFDYTSLQSQTQKTVSIKSSSNKKQKIVAILLLVLLAISGLVGAFSLALKDTATETVARNYNIFDLSSFGCNMNDDGAFAGLGWSPMIEDALQNKKGSNPQDSMFAPTIPNYEKNPQAPRNILEQYGYFSGNFSVWGGTYVSPNDSEAAFNGTLGTGVKVENELQIEEAGVSPFFAHNPLQCFAIEGTFFAASANLNLGLSKAIVAVAGNIYRWADTATLTEKGSPIYDIGQEIEKLITAPGTGLKTVLYLDFLIPMIVIGSIILLINGIVKRRFTQTWQDALWIIGSIVAGALFLANPLWVAKAVDSTVTTISSSASDVLNGSRSSTGMCSLPENSPEKTSREVVCTLWYKTVYTPWVVGQFEVLPDVIKADGLEASDFVMERRNSMLSQEVVGATGEGTGSQSRHALSVLETELAAKLNNNKIDTSSSELRNWAVFQLDREQTFQTNKGLDQSEIAFSQLVASNNQGWKGSQTMPAMANVSILSAAGPAIFLTVSGLLLISFQISMILLLVTAPVFFILGVAPGWGRKIAMYWVEVLVNIFIKQIILAVFLMIYVRLFLAIYDTPMNWFFQILLVTIVSFVALVYRKKLTEMITSKVDFGSGQAGDAIDPENIAKQGMAGVAGFAAGTAGALMKSKSRNDNNNNDDGSIPDINDDGDDSTTTGGGASGMPTPITDDDEEEKEENKDDPENLPTSPTGDSDTDENADEEEEMKALEEQETVEGELLEDDKELEVAYDDSRALEETLEEGEVVDDEIEGPPALELENDGEEVKELESNESLDESENTGNPEETLNKNDSTNSENSQQQDNQNNTTSPTVAPTALPASPQRKPLPKLPTKANTPTVSGTPKLTSNSPSKVNVGVKKTLPPKPGTSSPTGSGRTPVAGAKKLPAPPTNIPSHLQESNISSYFNGLSNRKDELDENSVNALNAVIQAYKVGQSQGANHNTIMNGINQQVRDSNNPEFKNIWAKIVNKTL